MDNYKTIYQQIIASTHEDAHGERITKEFLERISNSLSGKQMPLHQSHDMGKETVGYCENFNVVSDPATSEHYLKADVYFTCETLEEAIGGFSWSHVEGITADYDKSEYRICLPYPYYNDQTLISQIVQSDPNIGIGAYRKKALDPNTVALLFSGLCFAFGPMWNNSYNKHIVPKLKILLNQFKKAKQKGLTADFVQMVLGNLTEEIGVHFIPDRGREEESFDTEKIIRGLSEVQKFLEIDQKSKNIGLYRIKLFYDKTSKEYKIFHVEYSDGTDINIA